MCFRFLAQQAMSVGGEVSSNTVETTPTIMTDDDFSRDEVASILKSLLPGNPGFRVDPVAALVPWICDVLLSENSVKGYGRDLAHFAGHMRELGVDPVRVTADHVKLYKGALLKAGVRPATIRRSRASRR